MSSTFLLLGTAAGLEGGFTPRDVPGLVVGWEIKMVPPNLTLNGSNIIDWGYSDLIQYTQSLDGKRLDRAGSPLEGVSDGTDDFMVTKSTVNVTTFTNFLLARSSFAGNQTMMQQSTDSNTIDGFVTGNMFSGDAFIQVRKDGKRSTYSIDGGHALLTDGSYHLLRHVYRGSHAQHFAWIDGTIRALTSVLDQSPGADAVDDDIHLAAFNPTTSPWDGAFKAGFLYTGAVSDANALLVEAYMNAIP